MLVHFVHQGTAYLPELDAYARHLQRLGWASLVHTNVATIPKAARVIWWMCGRVTAPMQAKFPDAFHVHEYASASVPPFAWAKDVAKRWAQATPHHRVFQSPWVRERLCFADACPFDYRDMGVPDDFFSPGEPHASKEFDFVYAGDMTRLTALEHALDAIEASGKSLLLIGQVPASLQTRLRTGQMVTTGRIPQSQVPAQLTRARVGLNLVPARPPFSEQTSTKLLEYCALGLPVASIDYAWARRFEQQTGAHFYWLPKSSHNGDWLHALGIPLEQYQFATPDVQHLRWGRQVEPMSVWRRIEERR